MVQTRNMGRSLPAVGAALLLLCLGAQGSVHEYHGERFQRYGDAQIFRGGREGLYASRLEYLEEADDFYDFYDYDFGSVLLAPGVANGESYIRLDTITVRRSREDVAALNDKKAWERTGNLDVVVFELAQRDSIGAPAPDGSGWAYCCTEEYAEALSCTPGRAITTFEDENDFPWVTPMQFWGNNTEAQIYFDEGVVIPEDGMYYMWIISCDTAYPTLKVYGKSVWKNPGGYLPGMMRPFLKFCGVMSFAYMLLVAVWGGACYMNRDMLTHLQHCISVVIALSACETIAWYYDLVNFNLSGYRPLGITVWAVLFGCGRKTLSRLLLLLVSMGYGTMRPTLGGVKRRIFVLGGFYAAAITMYDVCANVGQIDDLSSLEKLVLVFPAAMLDAIIALTIFTSLSRTLAQLQVKKAEAKLEIYKQFTNALTVGVVISIVWLGYEAYFRVSDFDNSKWEHEWICNAFWYMLNFMMLIVIAFLWRPSHSFTRFAYSTEDSVGLAASSSKPKEAKPAVNTDVFAIDDEMLEAGAKEN